MSPILRFAPSPTGLLHVGNIRAALINWLYALPLGGEVILRLDDTDQERSSEAFARAIQEDLKWLGLNWSSSFKQSDRMEHYARAAEILKASGRLYPCYETPEELDRQRKLLRSRGKPPVYNRHALTLSDGDRKQLEEEGRQPHWRFKLSGKPAIWTDEIRGEQKIETSSLSDPVLIRADGTYLYTLPSVVDDIDAKVTHIVRGEDHVTNSGSQIEIFEALGESSPALAHMPLLVGVDGRNLSKRLGSLSMQSLRESGIEQMALLSLLAKIGTADPVELRANLGDLADEFSFSKIGRAPARFDEKELHGLNAKLIQALPFADVQARMKTGDLTENQWNIIRANIRSLDDVPVWVKIITGEIAGSIEDEDQAFCEVAANTLPDSLDESSWSNWTRDLQIETGRKGKSLYLPLRRALTGRDFGPEMPALLVEMGAERIKARLRGKRA